MKLTVNTTGEPAFPVPVPEWAAAGVRVSYPSPFTGQPVRGTIIKWDPYGAATVEIIMQGRTYWAFPRWHELEPDCG